MEKILNLIVGIKMLFTNPLGALQNLWQKVIDLKDQIVKAGVLGVLIFAASYFFTWWAGAVISFFYVAFKKEITGKEAFGVGMSAGLLVWAAYAGFLNSSNDGIMAARIGEMVSKGFLSSANIFHVTGLIGGLICGMGALTGCFAREFLYDTRMKFGWKW